MTVANWNVSALEPRDLWRRFAELNAVPRPSHDEARIREFVVGFGKERRLDVEVDEAGNVLIRKSATPGMEDRVPVVMQAHLDMVHQKATDVDFDFASEGIRMSAEGDWVSADGTTLGADNGIGAAAILAVLASTDLTHPALEALFTVGEETDMSGARGVRSDWLRGRCLLNLDMVADDRFTIGCAGGIDVFASGSYATEDVAEGQVAFSLCVSGLTGGHSALDINLGRANAIRTLGRALQALEALGVRLSAIDAGGLRNAIPREAGAVVTIERDETLALRTEVARLERQLRDEFQRTDPGLAIGLKRAAIPETVVSTDFQTDFLAALSKCPCGVYSMHPQLGGLVQSSNNLARVRVSNGRFGIECLARSSLESEKCELVANVTRAFKPLVAEIRTDGDFPCWSPDPEAPLLSLMREVYEDLFAERPVVEACHGGLECGFLSRAYPDMQMVSIGPNIHDPHSPTERVQVSSVQKFWRFLRSVLARMPKRGQHVSAAS